MRALLIASLALLLTACSTSGGGVYHRGTYGSAVQQQPVATNATLGQALHLGGKRTQHSPFQNCSQI